jgi:hypothetical protein
LALSSQKYGFGIRDPRSGKNLSRIQIILVEDEEKDRIEVRCRTKNERIGTGCEMFIPDPDFTHPGSRIPDLGSRITDPGSKNSNKREG